MEFQRTSMTGEQSMGISGLFRIMASAPKTFPGNIARCKEEILRSIDVAVENEVSLLLLPECCITSSSCGSLFFSDALLAKTEKTAREVAEYTNGKDIAVCFSFPFALEGKLYSVAALAAGGEILGLVPLGNNNDQTDGLFCRYTKRDLVISLCGKNVPFGVKLRFCCLGNDNLTIAIDREGAVRTGASVVLIPDASKELIGREQFRRDSLAYRSRTEENVYVYASSGEGETTSDGIYSSHKIIAEEGRILAESPLFESGYILADVDLAMLAYRRRIKKLNAGSEEVTVVPFALRKQGVSSTIREISRTPFVADDRSERHKNAQTALEIQSRSLAVRLRKTGTEKAIIGVSGGLDSTLALLCSVKTMDLMGKDRENVIAVSMPCFGTSLRTKGNAEKLSEILGVGYRCIDISEAVKIHLSDIGHDLKTADTAYENAQARERTQVLMDIANMENGLVVGTGDMSEAALGWCTFNGDHMSMYNVNCDLTKTFIRSVITDLAENSSDPELAAVLLDIVDTPVSPELLPSADGDIAQKTEDIIGPYEVHDFILYHFIRNGASREKILDLAAYAFAGVYDRDRLSQWVAVFFRRFISSQFKRNCVPDGPDIGSITLNHRYGWMMPGDISYSDICDTV